MSIKDATAKMKNSMVIDALWSRDSGIQKKAADTFDDYTRTRMREQGILRALIEPVPVTGSDFDIQVNYEEPAVVFEKEPDTPPSRIIPFGGAVPAIVPEGDRFIVVFHPNRTPKKRKSKYTLLAYRNDIRKILMDLDVNELTEYEDGLFFATVTSIVGAADSTVTATSSVQHKSIAGLLTVSTFGDAMKVQPKVGRSRFETHTVIMNTVTAKDLLKWNHTDVGPDLVKEIRTNGWTMRVIDGIRIIVTIKRAIVGDNILYMFSDADTLGKFLYIDDATVYTDAKAENLEWFVSECIGVTIAQESAVAKVTLSGS